MSHWFLRKLCSQLSGNPAKACCLCDTSPDPALCQNHQAWLVRLPKGRLRLQECHSRCDEIPTGRHELYSTIRKYNILKFIIIHFGNISLPFAVAPLTRNAQTFLVESAIFDVRLNNVFF